MPFNAASLTSLGGAVLAVALGAAPAFAGYVGVHPTEMQVIASDGFDSGVFLPAGTDEGGGVFNYQMLGYVGDNPDNWNMDWDFNAEPFYDPGASVTGNFVIRNTSDVDLDFEIVITMPLLSGAGPDAYFGSAAITIEHGTVTTPDSDSMWQGLIDGAVQTSLYDAPYSLSAPNGTDDDNKFAFGDYASASDSIGIRISLTLSAGGDFTMTSGFGIVPAPGALALLGLAAVGGRRRRR